MDDVGNKITADQTGSSYISGSVNRQKENSYGKPFVTKALNQSEYSVASERLRKKRGRYGCCPRIKQNILKYRSSCSALLAAGGKRQRMKRDSPFKFSFYLLVGRHLVSHVGPSLSAEVGGCFRSTV
jgi:hypothetical protein